MTERLEAARSIRDNAARIRRVATQVESRLAAELMWVALDLDKEAIELEAAVLSKPMEPANEEKEPATE